MGTIVISDKYGNMKKISGKTDNVSLILDMTENRKNISDKPDITGSTIYTSINKNRTDKKLKLTHGTCKKGSYNCREIEDGGLWLYIDTYKIRVNFCPNCGYRSKV